MYFSSFIKYFDFPKRLDVRQPPICLFPPYPDCSHFKLFQLAESISKIRVAIPLAGRRRASKIIGLPAHFRQLSILRPRRISSRIQLDRINTNAQVGAREIGTYGKGASEDKRGWARGNCIPRINLCRGRLPPRPCWLGSLWNFSIYLCLASEPPPVLFHIITNEQKDRGHRESPEPWGAVVFAIDNNRWFKAGFGSRGWSLLLSVCLILNSVMLTSCFPTDVSFYSFK